MKLELVTLFVRDKKIKVAKKLLKHASKSFRTLYLLDRMKANDMGASLVAIQSGPIDDQERNIAELTHFILSPAAKGDPKTFVVEQEEDSTSKQLSCLVRNLSLKCKPNKKKVNKKKVVQFLAALVEAGGDVESLNEQAGGNCTSPLIVATELALTTGKLL